MIKIRKNIKKFIFTLMFMALLLSMFPSNTFARTTVDISKKGSIKLEYLRNNRVSGVNFRIYKVADITKYAEFKLTDRFKDYHVVVSKDNAKNWLSIADMLNSYVQRDSLVADKAVTTDKTYIANFEDLDLGLYLVLGDTTIVGNGKYIPIPFLISVPSLDENKQWKYDVETFAKYIYDDSHKPTPDYVDRKVIKVWEDAGHEDERPSSIEVQLLRNGKPYSTVELSEKNDWKYRWNNLSADFTWKVVEKNTPEKYTVDVTKTGITFKMVNAYIVPATTVSEDDIVDDDIPEGKTLVEFSSVTAPTLVDEASIFDDELPQTGMLWWPVPVLLCAGIIMIIIGLSQKSKAE